MRKLLWCGGACLFLCLLMVAVVVLNPDNAIVGIENSESGKYEEMLVLNRNQTYEQFLRLKSTGAVVRHRGKWSRTGDDINSKLFAAQTGSRLDNDSITFKDILSTSRGADEPQLITMYIRSTMGLRPPDKAMLEKLKQWRMVATPSDVTSERSTH